MIFLKGREKKRKKENNCQPKILHFGELTFRNEAKYGHFLINTERIQYNRFLLQKKMLKWFILSVGIA